LMPLSSAVDADRRAMSDGVCNVHATGMRGGDAAAPDARWAVLALREVRFH
jgi:hypothetical protein